MLFLFFHTSRNVDMSHEKLRIHKYVPYRLSNVKYGLGKALAFLCCFHHKYEKGTKYIFLKPKNRYSSCSLENI